MGGIWAQAITARYVAVLSVPQIECIEMPDIYEAKWSGEEREYLTDEVP